MCQRVTATALTQEPAMGNADLLNALILSNIAEPIEKDQLKANHRS